MDDEIKVALLGQNAIIREGLHHILAKAKFRITQSVDEESQLSAGHADDLLIVIDGGVPSDNAESIRKLRRRFPAVKLVVLSDGFEFEAMAGAFRAGVHGYIIREIPCEPLVGSLRLVAMGEKVMPSSLVDALPRHHDGHERDHGRRLLEHANLSVREREILGCLILGCSNKAISRQLEIAETTVKVHVKAILRKLNVQNRTQAAIRGVNGGLEHDLVPMIAAIHAA